MSHNSLGKHLKDAADEIAKEEGFKDYKIVSEAQDFTGDNYVGDITRIEIRPSEGKSLHLIVKTASGNPELRKVMPMVDYYKNETYSYTTVMPAVQKVLMKNGIPSPDVIRFAKFYKSISEECKEAVIMKDMCRDGYVLHDKRQHFNQQHAEIVIKTLAQFHAASFVMKERDPEQYNELSKNLPHTNNYGDDMSMFTPSFLGHTSHIECPEKMARVNEYGKVAVEKLINVLDSKFTEPYNVICHGDCWNNNMLFKYEKERAVDVLLIDWQVVRIASPGTDLCYMMFMSMDAEYVKTQMEHLLDLYYLTLQENLSIMSMDIAQCYPREIFNKHVKRSMIYGFILGVCAIPVILSNPEDSKKTEDMLNDVHKGDNITVPINALAQKRYNNLINYFIDNELI